MLRLGLAKSPPAQTTGDTIHLNFSLLTDPSLSAPVRFGGYELLEEIGHGGMGLVYKARHLGLNRIVALKLLLPGPFSSPEMLSRFRREARAAAALSHPGIVPVYEVGESGGQSFLAMEYVEGRSLGRIIAEFGARSLEFGRMAQWMKGIAEAIAHAHAHGIVHRDLKPANILLDAEDRIRVVDFGLAKRLDDVSDLTLTGQVLGSPDYLAPEQASGKLAAPLPASDICATGAILYELLTGRPPFRSSSVQDTLLRIRDAEPVAPRLLNGSVPRDLEVICLKCLEKDPARRYGSSRELADELERFLSGEPIRARPIGPAGKVWRWCRRKPALAGMAAAVVTLLLSVTAVSVAAVWRVSAARKSEQREAYYSSIALADKLIQEGSIDRALETLWKCPEEYRHWEWGHLVYLCHQEAASFQAHANTVFETTITLTATFFSPDHRWVVSQDAMGMAKVWDWAVERELFRFGSATNRTRRIAFHPSGGQLAAAMGTNGVTVWTTTNWTSNPVGTRSTASPTSGNVIGPDSGAVLEVEKQSPPFTLTPAN